MTNEIMAWLVFGGIAFIVYLLIRADQYGLRVREFARYCLVGIVCFVTGPFSFAFVGFVALHHLIHS